jgi:hypothetical protein
MSPWSPSYAVHRQGSVNDEAELDTLEQLPAPANDVTDGKSGVAFPGGDASKLVLLSYHT